jgi:hypothetical protein
MDNIDITKSFGGKPIDYGTIYYQQIENGKKVVYKIDKLEWSENGTIVTK